MIKNLICMEDNKVSVIRLKDEKLEFVKKDGENEFPITVDFWEWWKEAVAYIEGESIDICFVYDKKYDLLNNTSIIARNIINTEESGWEIGHIKGYFWELKPIYFNIIIVGLSEQEYMLGGEGGVNSKRFYTNLDFKVLDSDNNINKEDSNSEEKLEVVTNDDFSPFAKYFIELIRRERG